MRSRKPKRPPTAWLLLGYTLQLTACSSDGDSGPVTNPSFDAWCGGVPCGWDLDQGSVERTGTWHTKDYGISFLETGTQISQTQPLDEVECLRFEMIADVATEARVVLWLDFDTDGTVDREQAVPAVRWENVPFVIAVPQGSGSVRYMLRKQGQGRAVVAQLTVQKNACSADAPSSENSE